MRTEALPMKITFKLYATLSDYLPAGQRHNAVELEVDADTTIADLVERFQLPARLVHLVLVNGVYVAPEQRMGRTLAPGDALAIWPPVAGG
jgi:sulfur carrier protein ThiS